MGRDSRTLFPGPQVPMNPTLYNALADLGFRRSGGMVYRHECDSCRACT
ncbi:MAG: arginyltransferase, partial [Planctomycetes bacterium]|nr:arginyltransferase [Planctomycetota bacterium]